MRNGQNKRMRGRNRKGGGSGGGGGHHHHQNPLSRMYESNGPEVKIRGSASHLAEKYLQLARDAQSSGDPVAAENFYQHAEHYFRLIAAAQEQFRQNNPYYQQQQTPGGNGGNFGDDSDDDGDDDGQPTMGGEPYAPQPQQNFYQREQQPQPQQQQQPYPPREPQPSFVPRDGHQQHQPQQHQPQQHRPQPPQNDGDVDRLPSFITGGGQPQQQPQQAHGPNGYDNQGGGGGDRFPLHRRRRRHRGPRDQAIGGDNESSAPDGPQPSND
jgi:hypothetical protein